MNRMFAVLSALAFLSVPAWGETEDVVLLHQEQTVVLKRPQVRSGEPVDAVLIVQNHAADEFRKPLSNLGDRVAAALSGDVFNIIDPNDALGEGQNRGPWGEAMPLSSATRLAENLGAKALVTASVNEASVVGAGAPARVQAIRMTLTLSAKHLPKGAAAAAATVTATSRQTTPELMAQNADAFYSELVGRLVEAAAAEFLPKCEQVAWNGDGGEEVEVAFACNFPGASVEIDGVSYGTAGAPGEAPLRVKVGSGLHNLRFSFPYTEPFETRAKFQDGATFVVSLHESAEGRKLRKEDRYFDALMDRIEKSGATDDEVRLLRARGYNVYLASSFTQLQGMPNSLQGVELGLNPSYEGDGEGASTQELIEKAGAVLGDGGEVPGAGGE